MAKVVDFVAEDVVAQLEYTSKRVGDAVIRARKTTDEGELQRLKKEVLVTMEDWRSRYRIARMLGIDLDEQAQELEELAGLVLTPSDSP
jgi:primosomal protein N''